MEAVNDSCGRNFVWLSDYSHYRVRELTVNCRNEFVVRGGSLHALDDIGPSQFSKQCLFVVVRRGHVEEHESLVSACKLDRTCALMRLLMFYMRLLHDVKMCLLVEARVENVEQTTSIDRSKFYLHSNKLCSASNNTSHNQQIYTFCPSFRSAQNVASQL